MEKVWRPVLNWERRPVTPLNGTPPGCFRKNFNDFVKECKTSFGEWACATQVGLAATKSFTLSQRRRDLPLILNPCLGKPGNRSSTRNRTTPSSATQIWRSVTHTAARQTITSHRAAHINITSEHHYSHLIVDSTQFRNYYPNSHL